MSLHGVERVVEFHICVEWVVTWTCLLFAVGVVERYADLRLVGEELTHLEIGGEAIAGVVVHGSLADTLLETSETVGLVFALQVDGTEVGELDVEVTLGSPSTLIVIFLESKLIEPHFTTLLIGREVAHTDNHRLDLAQRGVTHDGDTVLGILFVIYAELAVVACRTRGFGLIALFLQGGEDRQWYVEHILLRPYQHALLTAVTVIASRGGEL